MTLEEAIETLQAENKHPWNRDNSELRKAVKLGIEALNFRQRWEDQEGEDDYPLLPGETED